MTKNIMETVGEKLGLTWGSEVWPVVIAIVAAVACYGGRHMKAGADMRMLGMVLIAPTLLGIYFSAIRQDKQISELFRVGDFQKKHIEELNGRILAHRPIASSMEKMTGTRAMYDRNAHKGGGAAVANDVRSAVKRIEQHTNTHNGVRNASGYAPSRAVEQELIHGKSHLEDNPSFYASSSNDSSQSRTNIPTGYAFNRVDAADADGYMQLSDRNQPGEQQGRSVHVDHGAPPAPAAAPSAVQKDENDLARLFTDTSVSDDRTDNDVEGMKEGRSS
jgi:hypothetical protein